MAKFSLLGLLSGLIVKFRKKSPFARGLSYIDEDLEFEYQEFTKEKSQKALKFFLASIILLFIVNLISDEEFRQNENYVLCLALSIGFILLLFLFTLFLHFNQNFNNPVAFFMITQIATVIIYNEIFLQSQLTTASSTRIYTHGIVMQTLLLSSLISCCGWKNCGFSSTVLIIYLNTRLIKSLRESNNSAFSATTSLWVLIIIISASFLNERWDRNFYQTQRRAEENLEKFQHIIKKVIPCSILIFKKEKIVFYTHETRRILNLHLGAKIEDKLKNIVLSKMRSDLKDEEKNQGESSEIPSLDSDYPHNLYEYLTKYKKDYEQDLICGLVSFWGFYNEQQIQGFDEIREGPDMNWEKTLDIKMCNISWEGEEAQIVIISEDVFTQKIKHLREQARYKDKLLATVSHDLRTPLNGVIGILEMTMESVNDVSIKKKYYLNKNC